MYNIYGSFLANGFDMNNAYSNDVSLDRRILPFKIQKGKRNLMLIFCADSIYCKCAQNLTYFQFGMAAAHKQSKICSFLVCVLCSSNSMQNKVLKKSDSEEPINILTECTCAMHIGIRTYVWQICFCSHHFHSYSIFFCVNVKCLN